MSATISTSNNIIRYVYIYPIKVPNAPMDSRNYITYLWQSAEIAISLPAPKEIKQLFYGEEDNRITAKEAYEFTKDVSQSRAARFPETHSVFVEILESQIKSAINKGEYSIFIKINEEYVGDAIGWIESLEYQVYVSANSNYLTNVTIDWSHKL